MKIIDAHLHFWPENPYFDEIARRAGHKNTKAHLLEAYKKYGYAGGVVMGNHGLTLEEHTYPEYLRYCVGISFHEPDLPREETMLALTERHLRRRQCAGIKLYPGYDPLYLSDAAYRPYYALAESYGKPVAIHMGLTANTRSYLKYAHPLTLDEVATEHPRVQFVMCHFGNPWLADAVAVLMKNPNVAADLSGLFEGRLDVEAYLSRPGGYLEQLRTWAGFVGDYERLLYGTDWPLVHLKEYARLIAAVIPEQAHEKVFYENAVRVYGFEE